MRGTNNGGRSIHITKQPIDLTTYHPNNHTNT
jgi:hypothetical protein